MVNPQRTFPPGGGVKMPEDFPALSPLPYGLLSAGLKVYPVLLDQARTEHEIKISGNLIWAYRSSDLNANFNVKFNTLESDALNITEGFFIAGPKFSRLYITHAAQAGKYINILYTDDKRSDVRVINPNQSAATVKLVKPGTINSLADVLLAAGVTTLIKAAETTRYEIIITNLDAAETLRIGDLNAGAARGTPLPAGGNIILSTTAAVYGYNPGVAGVSVAVIETLE